MLWLTQRPVLKVSPCREVNDGLGFRGLWFRVYWHVLPLRSPISCVLIRGNPWM